MNEVPSRAPVGLAPAAGLSVDVEEWYHTCLVPDYVRPDRRPNLARELDWLLPEVLELFAQTGSRATFFTLGEVARQVPQRIREIHDAGHEVASHGFHHLRVGEYDTTEFRQDVTEAKELLEDTVGAEVAGYRSPEWSIRRYDNPKLRVLAEVGYHYDSSLAPYALAGSVRNPRDPCRFHWPAGDTGEASLVEIPPLAYGGPLRIPAAGWTGRLLPGRWIADRAEAALKGGRCPVMVVHPWELSELPTPGRLTGIAGFVHEAGRSGYRRKFVEILRRLPWRSLGEVLSPLGDPPEQEST
ncbi:MAG: polysaccharide deacetylase family protein [Thermoanaerobaculia bacterium]|nr:polysaccharide deacetylase family protein [Thermoanaerobaculia bacterium]